MRSKGTVLWMTLAVSALLFAGFAQAQTAATAPSKPEAAASAPPAATGPDAILGLWLTSGEDARIEIFKAEKPKDPAGDAGAEKVSEDLYGKYCGRIVWIADPNYGAGDPEEGKPRHDRKNPDPAKQGQPMVGLLMTKGFSHAGGNVWSGGTIYDPDDGKTYKCQMTLENPNTLNVRGYIGIAAFGRTTVWTRYSAPSTAAPSTAAPTTAAPTTAAPTTAAPTTAAPNTAAPQNPAKPEKE